MWTEITRPKYERKGAGYSSDLSDAEWAMIEPRLPQRNRLGRPPKTEMRRVVNALLYMVRTGCRWRSCRASFRLIRRCSIISTLGATAAYWSGSISSSCCKLAKRPDASPPMRDVTVVTGCR